MAIVRFTNAKNELHPVSGPPCWQVSSVLGMAMGHEVLGKTTGRYAIFDPGYLGTIKAAIEDIIADLMKSAGPALHAKLTQNSSPAAVSRP